VRRGRAGPKPRPLHQTVEERALADPASPRSTSGRHHRWLILLGGSSSRAFDRRFHLLPSVSQAKHHTPEMDEGQEPRRRAIGGQPLLHP